MLQLNNIALKYSYKKVLSDVCINFENGKIYSLLGENGAGKSTLAGIICGDKKADSGEIFVDSVQKKFHSPKDAINSGILCIHQRPILCEEISIKENFQLGAKKIDLKKAEELLSFFLPERKFSTLVKELFLGERFFVSLIGSILKSPKFLILDEPSALLDEEQISRLFDFLQKLKKTGITILIITHFISEALKKTDSIILLRDGIVVCNKESEKMTENEILKYLYDGIIDSRITYGNDGENTYGNDDTSDFKNDDMCKNENDNKSKNGNDNNVKNDDDCKCKCEDDTKLKNKNVINKVENFLDLQNLLLQNKNVTLIKAKNSIDFMQKEKEFSVRKTADGKSVGIIPSDRTFTGSNPNLSVFQICTALKTGLNKKELLEFCKNLLEKAKVNIKPEEKASSLSGGMLQKIILERELSQSPEKMILCEPWQGLDFLSCKNLFQKLENFCKSGKEIVILEAEK